MDTALGPLCSLGTEKLPRLSFMSACLPGSGEACRQTPGTRHVQVPRRGCPPASPPPEREEEEPRLALPASHPWASPGLCHLSSMDCTAGTIRDAWKTEAHPAGFTVQSDRPGLQQQMLVRLVGNLPGGPLSVLPTSSARSLKRNPPRHPVLSLHHLEPCRAI